MTRRPGRRRERRRMSTDLAKIFPPRDEFEADLRDDIVRAGHAELLTDDMSELDRFITTELVAEYARRMAEGMADQIYGPRKDDDAR